MPILLKPCLPYFHSRICPFHMNTCIPTVCILLCYISKFTCCSVIHSYCVSFNLCDTSFSKPSKSEFILKFKIFHLGLNARNLTLLHVNNKGANLPVHLSSLISAFVFSSTEPKAHGLLKSIPVTPVNVCTYQSKAFGYAV